MRLNLCHEDALNKETSEPLEDDFDKPSTMPTRLLALSAQNLRLNFWDFRRSHQRISWSKNGQSVNDIKDDVSYRFGSPHSLRQKAQVSLGGTNNPAGVARGLPCLRGSITLRPLGNHYRHRHDRKRGVLACLRGRATPRSHLGSSFNDQRCRGCV